MAKLERENRELRKVNEVVKARRVSSVYAGVAPHLGAYVSGLLCRVGTC